MKTTRLMIVHLCINYGYKILFVNIVDLSVAMFFYRLFHYVTLSVCFGIRHAHSQL
jgi:hypothetical protein